MKAERVKTKWTRSLKPHGEEQGQERRTPTGTGVFNAAEVMPRATDTHREVITMETLGLDAAARSLDRRFFQRGKEHPSARGVFKVGAKAKGTAAGIQDLADPRSHLIGDA